MLEDSTMRHSIIGLILTLALGLLVAPFCSNAQQPGKVYRIAFLWNGMPPPPSVPTPRFDAFRQQLHELGWGLMVRTSLLSTALPKGTSSGFPTSRPIWWGAR